MMIEDNGILKINADTQSSGTAVLTLQDNDDSVLTVQVLNLLTLVVVLAPQDLV
jgi:hypothetical protein